MRSNAFGQSKTDLYKPPGLLEGVGSTLLRIQVSSHLNARRVLNKMEVRSWPRELHSS